jgi:hypothetical protein
LYAQVGLDSRTKKGIAIPADKKELPPLKPNNTFNKPKLPTVDLNNPLTEPKPFYMDQKSDLLDAGQELQKKWDESKMKASGGRDQYLGDFITNGTFLSIECRDHLTIDGDRIQIIVNDVIIEYSMTLTSNYQGVNIDLVDGFNKIEILALNQGYAGENTAKFRVIDFKGEILTAQQWFLSTGFRASFIIVK